MLMRSLVLSFCVLVVVARPQEELKLKNLVQRSGSDPELSADCYDSAGNPLSGKPYEKPGDCDSFYQCSGGYRTEQDCAEGTVFNPTLSVCDHPENVPGCGGSGTVDPTDPPTDPPTYHPDCLDADGNPISGAPFENPDNCGSFYQCSNGYRYEQDCAPGTVFNPEIGVCDWPYNVPGCGGTGTTEPPPGTTAPPIVDPECICGETKEKTGDCNGFYQCVGGIFIERNCPSDLAFNPDLGVCDFPENVEGCPQCECKLPFATGGDCPSSNFYLCVDGVIVENHCAPGLVFDSALSVCNRPENVDCDGDTGGSGGSGGSGSTSDLCVGPSGEPLSTDPFEKPGDCWNFYQCGAGILYVMPCAPGTAFNPVIGVCDWPYEVPGCT